MGINIPENAKEIFDRMTTDVVNELGELNPYLSNSLIRAMMAGNASAFFEEYKTMLQLQALTFWDTTTGPSLERWAAIFSITRNAATISTGFVTFTGVDTSVIPINAQFTSTSGDIYQTTASGTISANTLSVDSITRVSGTVTVTTALNHGLASNLSVLIAGAVQTEYNGTVVITVTGLKTFTYSITTTPTTPATGTITVAATYANIAAESSAFGQNQNLISGTPVSLASPIAGVDNTAYVSFSEMGGGADIESDINLRDRFLFRVQNQITGFNDNAIIAQARLVPGITRVFVQNVDSLLINLSAVTLTRAGNFATFTTATPHGIFDGQPVTITGATQPEYNVTKQKVLKISNTEFGFVVFGSPTTPATGTIVANASLSGPGQVRVFPLRDNDIPIIPTAGEITDVKNKLLEIKDAPMSELDLIVEAPTPVVVPFVFSALSPNTVSMQAAITEALTAYFSSTVLAKDISKIDYESIINATLDSSGNTVQSFTLSSPTTSISVGSSSIAVLGTITYP